MDRRTFLAAAAVGLAGCRGDGEEAGTPAGTPAAAGHLAAATEHVAEAGDQIEAETDSFGGVEDGGSFDTAAITDALDSAAAALDEAEAAGDADRPERIEALRGTVAFFRAVADALGAFGAALGGLATATTASEENRYGDAIEAARSSRDDLERARGHAQTAADRRDRVDAGPVPAAVPLADVTRTRDELAAGVDGLSGFVDGYVALNRGLQRYDAAGRAVAAENWATAEDEYAAARDRFENAAEQFRNGESAAPAEFGQAFADAGCAAEALRAASEHFRLAMAARERGDQETYQEELSAGQDAANRCS